MKNIAFAVLSAAVLVPAAHAKNEPFGDQGIKTIVAQIAGQRELNNADVERMKAQPDSSPAPRNLPSESGVHLIVTETRDQALGEVRKAIGSDVMAISKKQGKDWTSQSLIAFLDSTLKAQGLSNSVVDDARVPVASDPEVMQRVKALKAKGTDVYFIRYKTK